MVSSARNPNESYAERARKASTSSSSRSTQQNQHHTTHAPTTQPSSSLKPPPVNVWAERVKEQQAHAASQPAHMPPQRATSSPQPPRDDAIQPRSPPPDLSAQLAILNQQDEHDPFVVRVLPHLSRQSSSSTNPLPAADSNAWPLPGAEPHSNASPADYDSPFLSAAPSRQSTCLSLFITQYPSPHYLQIAPLLFGTMLIPYPDPWVCPRCKALFLRTLVPPPNQEPRADPAALYPVHVCRSVVARCHKTSLFSQISD